MVVAARRLGLFFLLALALRPGALTRPVRARSWLLLRRLLRVGASSLQSSRLLYLGLRQLLVLRLRAAAMLALGLQALAFRRSVPLAPVFRLQSLA